MRRRLVAMLDKAHGLLSARAQSGRPGLTAVGTQPSPSQLPVRPRHRLVQHVNGVAVGQQPRALSTSSSSSQLAEPHQHEYDQHPPQHQLGSDCDELVNALRGSRGTASSYGSAVGSNGLARPADAAAAIAPQTASSYMHPVADHLYTSTTYGARPGSRAIPSPTGNLQVLKDAQQLAHSGHEKEARQLLMGQSSQQHQQPQQRSTAQVRQQQQWQPPRVPQQQQQQQQQQQPLGPLVGCNGYGSNGHNPHSSQNGSLTTTPALRQQPVLAAAGPDQAAGYNPSHQPWPPAAAPSPQQQQQQELVGYSPTQWPLSQGPTPDQQQEQQQQQQQQLSGALHLQREGQQLVLQHTDPSSLELQQEQRSRPPSPVSISDIDPDDVIVCQRSGGRYHIKERKQRLQQVPEDVFVVDSPATANAVVDYIHSIVHNKEGRSWTGHDGRVHAEQEIYFACDTEVAGIEVKTQSPVGHGVVICFSIYAGPWLDFSAAVGSSRGQPVVAAAAVDQQQQQLQQGRQLKNRIWVDLAAGWYEKMRHQLEQQWQQQREEESALLQQAATAGPDHRSSRRKSKSRSSSPARVAVEALEPTSPVDDLTRPTAAAVAESAAEDESAEDAPQQQRSVRRRSAAAAEQILLEEKRQSTDPAPLSEEILPSVVASGRRRRKPQTAAAVTSLDSSSSAVSSFHDEADTSRPGHSGVVAMCSSVGTLGPLLQQEQQQLPLWEQQQLQQRQQLEQQWGLPASGDCSRQLSSSSCSLQPAVAVAAAAGAVAMLPPAAVYGEWLPAPTLEDILNDESARGILQAFRRFFEDPSINKVWHNYGFDRHVLETLYTALDAAEHTGNNSSSSSSSNNSRDGVDQGDQPQQQQQQQLSSPPSPGRRRVQLQGFGGDTLHMSRLWNASRKLSGGYSLESLSSDAKLLEAVRDELGADALLPKRSMKERFGMYRFKTDGLPVKVPQIPAMHVLHTDPLHRPEWIDYSALDAKATWNVHRALKQKLQGMTAFMDEYLCKQLVQTPDADSKARMQRALEGLENAKSAQSKAAGSAAAKQSKAAAGPRSLPSMRAPPPPRPRPRTSSGKTDSESASAHVTPKGPFYTLWDLYCDYWHPFGEVLTDMEAEGVRVNRDHLIDQERLALQDQKAAEAHFRNWVKRYVPGGEFMNVNSGVQIRQLLFPGEKASATDVTPSTSKTFKAVNPEYDQVPRPKGVRRHIDFKLHGLWGKNVPGRLKAEVRTDKDLAAVSGAVLWSLVGKPGAAAKALADLDAREQAAAATAAQAGSTNSKEAAAVSLLDEDDIITADEDLDHGDHPAAAAAGDGSSDGQIAVIAEDVDDPEELQYWEQRGKELKLGKMFAAMAVGKGPRGDPRGEREGIEACLALEKLIEVSAIDKLLSAFIQPLQSDNISTSALVPLQLPAAAEDATAAADGSSVDDSSSSEVFNSSFSTDGSSTETSSSEGSSRSSPIYRVHCSLNLNTETGRLSARRPNLQNQPALEKDRYKVRKAFCAEPGKTLVVADYGQLELRLLAHITDCKSMIRAFELGGDFHSRTALGMYDHIKDDIAAGGCLLEIGDWHGEGDPPPLLKDKYGSERRKAKILNFSIAYGKTAHGLSKDFGVSLEEAEATVNRWYADRPEVREWQEMTKRYAAEKGWVNTMVGRRRDLIPGIRSSDKWVRARSERAAINTPIQGSAADVASAAMLAIVKDEWLRENGWKLLLQVHDEVMLEGPKETSEEAKQHVVAAMMNPWKNLSGFEGMPLRVELAVDANIADTWYEAK